VCVNGVSWQSFFPNVLKTVLCCVQVMVLSVLCSAMVCRYRWVCRGETLLQGEYDVYEHSRLFYVCLSHRLRPYWWLLLHRWVQRTFRVCVCVLPGIYNWLLEMAHHGLMCLVIKMSNVFKDPIKSFGKVRLTFTFLLWRTEHFLLLLYLLRASSAMLCLV